MGIRVVHQVPLQDDDEMGEHEARGSLLFQVKERFALRYPRHCFWSRGYFAHTAGVTDLQTQVDYVENQEFHHGVIYLS